MDKIDSEIPDVSLEGDAFEYLAPLVFSYQKDWRRGRW